jgi:PEGA domain-containing protein
MKDDHLTEADADEPIPSSAADPDVREAVEDLLIGICARLSYVDLPAVRVPEADVEEDEETEDDWGDDRPTPDIRYALYPPPPESESGRVTDPDILSGALVYSHSDDSFPDDDDDSPRISVTSMLDEIEIGAPMSLRPMSRTSFPEPEIDRRGSRFWLGMAALTVAAGGTLWWLSHNQVSAFDDTSIAAHVEAMPPRQGITARSTTKGAHLFIDGKDQGALPLVVHDMTAGKHEIRFEAPLHIPVTRTLVLTSGQVVDLGDVSLLPKRESIRVELTPMNAYLQLTHTESRDSQRFAGPWPRVLELAPGQYDVMAFRGGYRTWAMRLRVEPGREQLITWRIELPSDDIYAD